MSLFFDRMGRYAVLFFIHTARFSTLVLNTLRASARMPSYLRIIFAQMMRVGVRSLPIVAFTSAFMGMVTSVQAVYQFQSYVPIYLVGSVVTESVVLELGPVLTALVLSGRVGATIAAELGTVVIGGLFTSTILTLLVIPVVYSLVDDARSRLRGQPADG